MAEMNLKKIKTGRSQRGEFVGRRLDGHGDLFALWQARRHRAESFKRNVPWRFRKKNEPEAIRSAAIGELGVGERRQPTNLEADAVDHARAVEAAVSPRQVSTSRAVLIHGWLGGTVRLMPATFCSGTGTHTLPLRPTMML